MSGPSETSDYIVQNEPFFIKSKQKGKLLGQLIRRPLYHQHLHPSLHTELLIGF